MSVPHGSRRAPRLRAGLLGVSLLACACNFTIDGIGSPNANGDAGNSPLNTTPGPDGATPADLPPAADLYTSSPDLYTPLPESVGDACTGSCGAGLTCMSWVPAGYCSESCDAAGTVCPIGSTCVDIGNGSHYCLSNANGSSGCMRADLSCRDCGASVCGPSSFCDGC